MSRKPSKAPEHDKPMTKYDRKVEARKKEAAREKRNSIIFRTICILFLAGIIGTAGYFSVKQYIAFHTATTETYVAAGEHDITKLEYDYYFNSTVNNFVNNYSYFLSAMGLDTTKPFDEQQYSEEMTWQEYFEQMTLEQIRQEYALIDDAKAVGFEYDITEDYNTFIDSAKEAAKNNQVTMGNYYKAMFGDYATAHNIKPIMENSFLADAYYDKLMEDNTPADDLVSDYYNEHKTEYDKVSYYSFNFDPANYTDSSVEEPDTEENNDSSSEDNDDSSEGADNEETDPDSSEEPDTEEDTTGTTAYTLAEEMKKRLENGEDFETLCIEYAQEDQKANYEALDSEYSLTENTVIAQTNQTFQDWLADESRKAGDITIVQAEETGMCYVIKFVSRTYDETCLETISNKLASEAVTDYVNGLLENNYEVKDIKGEISYLKEEEETSESSSDTSSDSESNTSTVE